MSYESSDTPFDVKFYYHFISTQSNHLIFQFFKSCYYFLIDTTRTYISFPSSHFFNKCPTYLEIRVISLLLLKFSIYPIVLQVLASWLSDFTTFLRIISYLSLFSLIVDSATLYWTSSSERASTCFSWTLNIFTFNTELQPS